jgi:hypothetical protein
MVATNAITCSKFRLLSKISQFYNKFEHTQYCENCSLLNKKK